MIICVYVLVAAAKEQNHVDQSTAFLHAARLKPATGVNDLESKVMDYKFKVNGSHVPGCGGGCSVVGNGVGGCGTSFDSPASGLSQHRNAAGLKKVRFVAVTLRARTVSGGGQGPRPYLHKFGSPMPPVLYNTMVAQSNICTHH